jgi:lipoprotein-releasing system permease protein
MSDALHLEVSQAMDIYFVDSSSSRVRRYYISGIYDTTLEGLDQSVIIGDIREVQRLNGWTPEQVGGIELLLHRPTQAERTAREIREIASRYGLEEDDPLSIKTVKEVFPHLFDWLTLIDMNLLIVMILMIAVAGVNMISGLLIMLFDKTSMIGLLKALGMKNGEIRIAFIYRMGGLIVRGMVIGNAIALLLCWVQKKFTLITLDQANYAVSSVPINMNVWGMCLMNTVSFLLILALMLLASMTVTRISPERSLRIK